MEATLDSINRQMTDWKKTPAISSNNMQGGALPNQQPRGAQMGKQAKYVIRHFT